MPELTYLTCPTCASRFEIRPDSKSLPFCCEHCRLADLNGWFTEVRSLPHIPDPEDDEPVPDEEYGVQED